MGTDGTDAGVDRGDRCQIGVYWIYLVVSLVGYPCRTVGGPYIPVVYPVYPRWCTERTCVRYNMHIYGLGRRDMVRYTWIDSSDMIDVWTTLNGISRLAHEMTGKESSL